MNHLHTPPAFDGGSDAAEHLADVTGTNPEALDVMHTVPVTVVDEVTVKERRARTVVVEAVPLDVAVPQRVLNEVRQRSRAYIKAAGGTILIGTRATQIFPLAVGDPPFLVEASSEVWALGSGAGCTANVYSEHRDG